MSKSNKQPKQPNENKLSKQESSKLEHISNACVIGLANLYGITQEIEVPTTKDIDNIDTYLNLIVKNVEFPDDFQYDFQIEPFEKAKERITNEMKEKVKKGEIKEKDLTSKIKGQLRNVTKSNNARFINGIFEYIKQKDPSLNCDLSKKKTPSKTVRLMKYRWIDPFNEEGFKLFGIEIMKIMYGMKDGIVQSTAKWNRIKLEINNQEISNKYFELLKDQSLLSKHGL